MNDEQAYTVVGGRGTMTVFEIYIKTTPERLWEAITERGDAQAVQLRRRHGLRLDRRAPSTRSGVPGVIDIASGENLEVDPPRRLVQSFTALWSEEVKSEGHLAGDLGDRAGRHDSCRLRGHPRPARRGRQQRTLRRLADDPLRPEDAAGDRRGPDTPGSLRYGGV